MVAGKQIIKLTLILERLLNVEDNLMMKRVLTMISKVRNTLVYRGFTYEMLFRKDESETSYANVSKEEFITRCETLRIPDLKPKDLE
jgi:hypothetical protein